MVDSSGNFNGRFYVREKGFDIKELLFYDCKMQSLLTAETSQKSLNFLQQSSNNYFNHVLSEPTNYSRLISLLCFNTWKG